MFRRFDFAIILTTVLFLFSSTMVDRGTKTCTPTGFLNSMMTINRPEGAGNFDNTIGSTCIDLKPSADFKHSS